MSATTSFIHKTLSEIVEKIMTFDLNNLWVVTIIGGIMVTIIGGIILHCILGMHGKKKSSDIIGIITKESNRILEKILKKASVNYFENINQPKYIVHRTSLNSAKINFKDYLPSYLKALLQRYERIIRPWKEENGSFFIKEIVQLELREEEQKEEKKYQTEHDENERYSEKLYKNLLFSNAIKENQKLLIIGDPGAGKSTSLQWITYFYAEQISRSRKELPVPIYLELKWYKNNLLELIATCFGEKGIVCDEETIEDWIKKGRFLFILDGFDEVRDPSECLSDIKQLMGLSIESRFVVASRKIEHLIKDFQSLGFKEAEVKQLSDSQVELFIEKYLEKEKGNVLLKELKRHNLLNEARNPLILWLITLEFRRDESQISINKGMLFKNVIEHHFLKVWEKKVIHSEFNIQKYMDLKVKILSKLAFSMIGENDSLKIEEAKAEEIIDAFLREGRTDYKDLRDEILKQLFASHILIKAGSQISFWHKSFRDYFTALELIEVFKRNPKKFVKQYGTERWEESILFFVGIIDNPSDFVDRLVLPFWRHFLRPRDSLSYRLFLGAKCIGQSNKVSTKTQQKVIEQLTKIIQQPESVFKFKSLFFPILFDVDKAFQALGETKLEKAAEILGEFLENHKCNAPLEMSGNRWCYLCELAVKALEKMSLPKKVQDSLLFAALRHEAMFVREYAGKILRENMTQEIASRLVEIMLNKNERQVIHRGVFFSNSLVIEDYLIRMRAIDIMCGYPGEYLKYPDKVIEPLIQIALEEERDDLRRKAAGSLSVGHHKTEDQEEKIINRLIHALLKNPNASIRANAAYALLYHFSNKVPKALIQALDDKDEKVLQSAAHTLAYIRPNTSEEENEASQKLLRLFNDKNVDVRINALYTYKFIRKSPTNEEITQLINLLKDENILIRCESAEALGRLKAKNALDVLKHMVMVKDEKYVYPRTYAIWAILQIEPSFSEVVKEKGWEYPYIIKLYSDDIDERRMAAEVLRRIGTEISLPSLKKINKDYDKKKGISGELFYAICDIEERIKRSNK